MAQHREDPIPVDPASPSMGTFKDVNALKKLIVSHG